MLLNTPRTLRRSATRRAAFTLLEVLVVVAILVILAGVASFSIFGQMEKAKKGKAKTDMATLKKAIEAYYTEHGDWPQSISQVAPLLEQGEQGTYNPWGQQYQFQIMPIQQSDGTTIARPVVFTHTKDGEEIWYPEDIKNQIR